MLLQLDKATADAAEFKAGLDKAAVDAVEMKAGYDKATADAAEFKAGFDKMTADFVEQKEQVGCSRRSKMPARGMDHIMQYTHTTHTTQDVYTH